MSVPCQPFSADRPGAGTHPFSAFTASVLRLRPQSTGHLALKSSSPDDYIGIHPNICRRRPTETLSPGSGWRARFARAEPVRSLITEEYAPGSFVPDDDAAILEWVRNTATTIYHYRHM